MRGSPAMDGGKYMRSRIAQRLANILDDAAGPPPSPAGTLKAAFAAEPETKRAPAPIRVPSGFGGRDYLSMLLHVAAEIEHALLVQYLFAAYSLGGPQVPEEHRSKVQEWQTILLGIAKEEMAHFVTVQNVLLLIGAPLNLEREDFPWDLDFAPFEFSLEKLTPASLARYVYVESPKKWPADAAGDQRAITDLASQGQPRRPKRVGELYAAMIALIEDTTLIPESAFQASTMAYQASWDEWGRGYRDGARGSSDSQTTTPDLLIGKAYSRASAADALRTVAEQGEAPDIVADIGEKSHFRRFYEIWKQFPKEGEWSPVRDLARNPTTVEGLENQTYIADPQARRWAHLLNLRYRILLTCLGHSFRLSGQGEGDPDSAARGLVLHATFGEMYNLRVLSNFLVRMPVKGKAGALAGPTFEMPYTLQLPSRRSDLWRLQVELIDASDSLIAKLRRQADSEERAYLDTLAAIDARRRSAMDEMIASSGGRRTRMGGWA
ncbi:MAG TPA: ferritin-like domain-containing protein [Allosphingosinicella sp.]|jgi:hypothetical protein|nr:ferritin-like domain-containing protein [Allosphingosinicella sp.]